MTCDSTIITSLNVYLPGLEEDGIRPIPFLRACNEVRKLLGVFGRSLQPVKYLITANTQELYTLLKKHGFDRERDLRNILQNISNENEELCEVVQRVLRCLSFTKEVLEDLADPCSEEKLNDRILEVYQRHLEPLQSPAVTRLAHLCFWICPSKTTVLAKLKENNASEESLRAEITKAASKISKVISELKVISDQWTFTNTYFE